MSKASLGGLIAICFALATPAALRAAPIDDAKAAFLDGKAAYERGDYERALVSFQKANLIQPAPTLSFNIGKTFEHLGRYREAVGQFERYLEQAGAATTPEETQFQDNLRSRIANLKTRPDAPTGRAMAPPPQQPTGGEVQPPPAVNPQYNVYYYPQPGQPGYNPYYQGYTLAPPSKLDLAKRRRSSGIGLLVSGLAIEVLLGVTCFGVGASFGGELGWYYAGAFFVVVGTVLWVPGAVLVGVANAEIARLQTQPQPMPGQPGMSLNDEPARRRAAFELFAYGDGRRGAMPTAAVFSLPPIRF